MLATSEEQRLDQRDALTRGFYLEQWLVEPLKGTLTPSVATGKPRAAERAAAEEDAVHLEPKVMDVLLSLAASDGAVVRRDELLEQVWGDVVVSEEVLTRCISELRSALGDNDKTRRYIQTLPKRGYRLLQPVQALAQRKESAATNSPSVQQAESPTDDEAQKQTLDGRRNFLISLFPALMVLASVAFVLLIIAIKPGPSAAPALEQAPRPTPAVSTDELPRGDVSNTLAVLPFVNLSGDAETDSFSNGLTADIRNTVARVGQGIVSVVARTSSEAFRGKAMDIRSIGEQLGAERIVEGTVRIADNRVRVTAQLTNTINGFPDWAQRFEYNLQDGLLIQSDIADHIAALIVPDGGDGGEDAADFARQTDLKAYDYYLLGRHHWNLRTVESLQLAQTYFQQALDIDPNYALAMSGLADSLVLELEYSKEHSDSQVDKARELATRARELQPGLAEVHASLGALASYRSTDLAAAEAALRRAIEIKPSYSMARMWLGNVLLEKEQLDDAFAEYLAALKSDPLNTVVRSNYLRSLNMRGYYDKAGKIAAQYFTENPSDALLKTWMHSMLSSGQYDKLLKFAVRHSFSPEYAAYGREMLIEALIYLQRYEEADSLYRQFAADSGQSAKAWYLASLAMNLQDAQTLRKAAQLMENDVAGDNPLHDCKRSLSLYWRGVSAYIDRDYASAASLSERALQDTDSDCIRDLPRRAHISAYLSDALRKTGATERADQLLHQALAEIETSMKKGRDGLDIALAKTVLLLTLNETEAAREELQRMDANNWQFYAILSTMPLCRDYQKALQPEMRENEQKFLRMQEASRNIGLAKFGL